MPTPAPVCRTTCPYCGVGCGVTVEDSRVNGDAQHPANLGKLCVKGTALGETLSSEGRLTHPRVDGKSASWDQAIQAIAEKLQSIKDPSRIAFYLSGQLLTEDYYVANKLAKGFLGTANVDTNSRLCMSSAVAAHTRAFGEDLVPGCYDDLEAAEQIILVGSNLASNHPIVYQRVAAAKARNPDLRVWVIDPRQTETSDIDGRHLALKPDTDLALFLGLLQHLRANNLLDREFIGAHVDGASEAVEAAMPWTPQAVAQETGLDVGQVEQFYAEFGERPKTVTVFSQGINQQVQGTDTCNAIINIHLATGRIGKLGATPFSITGQPNAMGGREVGGLANQLAVHLGFTPAEVRDVEAFWQAPHMAKKPGLKALDLVDAMDRGEIDFLWVLATNPAVSLPNSERVRRAFAKCSMVVVSEAYESTDTLALANIALPATSWSEKSGTVTNSERCISRQRAFKAPLGQAKQDWQALQAVAQRLGVGDRFNYRSSADVFREYAAMTEIAVAHGKQLDLRPWAGLSEAEYDALSPSVWPRGQKRLFTQAQFSTPNGRAKMLALKVAQPETTAWPLQVNTGRIRDQWHTMTRTGRVSRLMEHTAYPEVWLHPDDCVDFPESDLVKLTGPQGEYVGRLKSTSQVSPGQCFVPIHWTDDFAQQALASRLMSEACDPISGQPASKSGQARASRCDYGGAVLLIAKDVQAPSKTVHWEKRPLPNGWVQLICCSHKAWSREATLRFLKLAEPEQWFEDRDAQRFRCSGRDYFVQGARTLSELSAGQWLAEQDLHPADTLARLAATAGGPQDRSPLVCSCHSVQQSAIENAIKQGSTTVQALGQALKCGTQCGSCQPELKQLLKDTLICG